MFRTFSESILILFWNKSGSFPETLRKTSETFPEHFRNKIQKCSGIFPDTNPDVFRMCFRKASGHFLRFPGTKKQNNLEHTSGTVLEIYRICSGHVPEHSWNNSRTFPDNFRICSEKSRKLGTMFCKRPLRKFMCTANCFLGGLLGRTIA